MEKKTTATEPPLSWLTRILMMLGLASKKPTPGELVERARDQHEHQVRLRLPEEVRDGEILPLVFHPNPILKIKSRPVEKFDDDLYELVKALGATMYMTGGVGLSAIQVGIPLRIFVADMRTFGDQDHRFRVFVNPVVLSEGSDVRMIEGCLSLPNVREPVVRSSWVKIKAQHYSGVEFETMLSDWPARIFLHEYDHLDGRTMLDELSPMVRRLAEKRLNKLMRSVKHDTTNGQLKAQKRAARGRGR
jgi:peptide deformylase